jgi:transcriptional regulator with XRE-family HTH domain
MSVAPEFIYLVIGRSIREAREAEGLTQDELAGLVGCGRTTIVNIEAGRQRILVHKLVEIAENLGVSVSVSVSALVPIWGDKSQDYEVTVRSLVSENRQIKADLQTVGKLKELLQRTLDRMTRDS